MDINLTNISPSLKQVTTPLKYSDFTIGEMYHFLIVWLTDNHIETDCNLCYLDQPPYGKGLYQEDILKPTSIKEINLHLTYRDRKLYLITLDNNSLDFIKG